MADVATTAVVVNAPPAVNAGGPYSGTEGSPRTLAGTATDPTGDPPAISWSITWTGDPGTLRGDRNLHARAVDHL